MIRDKNKIRYIVAILITTAVFSGISSYCQEPFHPEFSIGIKAGGITSKAFLMPNVKQLLNYGVTGGIMFKYISEPNLGLQADLNYIQKGWTEEIDSSNRYTRDLDYFQMVFLTQYMPGKKNTKFLFNIGPYISFLLNESEKDNFTDYSVENDYYGEKVDKNFELGACLGLGVVQYTKIGAFQLESRFEYSFSDFFENKQFYYSQNLAAGITLAYLFYF